METEFYKKCSDCGKTIYYSTKAHLQNAIKKNRTKCMSCCQLSIPQKKIICKKCGIESMNNINSVFCKDCKDKNYKEYNNNFNKKKAKELNIFYSDLRKYGHNFLLENTSILELLQITKKLKDSIKDIEKNLSRKCPVCGEIKIYKNYQHLTRAIELNNGCNKCRNKK